MQGLNQKSENEEKKSFIGSAMGRENVEVLAHVCANEG